MIWLTALALMAPNGPPADTPGPSHPACDKPVLMVITGTTHDGVRMRAYGQAIADSKLYEELGGYYLNFPAPLAHFEGEAEPGHTTLIVRFPCIENARSFWYSRTYQEEIRPLRLDPSAGDYIVRVYAEAPMRGDLAGKVESNAYLEKFNPDGIEQVETQAAP
ncbi:hypothetical protein A9995_14345 [Erythrobacter sp. QSSC1-22B]|uniref:DUF1330 domain-containing protein n=1 Tax=Erythrobacter sp. QSSC1-22B TaxID=1860125 RepID=UPI000805F7CF|nr:DUF1330 domain-containing protein [Erythrobacter sp. QSSC1-22B]OBX17840.1 hypothetical protein A9995_14345 [Erythrobacter sp. QSSC1-22B]